MSIVQRIAENLVPGLLILTVVISLAACGGDTTGEGEQPSVLETAPTTAAGEDGGVFAEYSTFIENGMKADGLPGVAVAIVRGKETVFVKGFGLRDVENNKPVTPDTLFHIGSTNKSMTAMIVATLVDDGLFDWDTPAVEIYPDFELSDPGATKAVTVRHLLSMRGGIPEEAEDDMDEDTMPEDIFPLLPDVALLGMPGEKFSYSNISCSVAGYLAVLASGGDADDLYGGYADLLQERVLDPIGMKNSVIRYSDAKADPNYGKSYVTEDGSFEVAEPEDSDTDPLAPAGVLKSSAVDMALYISTQLNRGVAPNGTRVVSEKNLTETWKPYLENYAMGWEAKDYRGVELISHEGTYDNYNSIIGFVPELDMGFVILANSEGEGDVVIGEGPTFLVDLFLDNKE